MERVQERFAQHAQGDIRGRAVGAAFGLSVGGEVLQGSDHPALIAEAGIALKAAHRRDAHTRHQVGIFAVSFLHAAPPRLARHIHHRGQRLVRAAQARLGRGHGE